MRSQSCRHCGRVVSVGAARCSECGHHPHLPRGACLCPACTRSPRPVTEADVEAVVAELLGRKERDRG